MTTHKNPPLPGLDRAIDELQSSVEATRVPGELTQWLTPVQQALMRVHQALADESLRRHRADFKDIVLDVSLVPKVQQLEAEDHDLWATVQRAEALAAKASAILEKSHSQDEHVATVTELGELVHSLVIRLRAQEQAIDTWFLESINRDEGVSG